MDFDQIFDELFVYDSLSKVSSSNIGKIVENSIRLRFLRYIREKKGIKTDIHKKWFQGIKLKNDLLKTGLCIHTDCTKYPSFNFPDEREFLYCSKHKLFGMVNVHNITCIEQGCRKGPIFNYFNKTKPIYCALHKAHDMVDVKHKRCAFKYCRLRAYYNYLGEYTPKYCNKHKLECMVETVYIKCLYDNCDTKPSFNYPNDTKRIYCMKHKLKGMVNVGKNRYRSSFKKCLHDGCNTKPSFNYPNDTTNINNTNGPKRLYCFKHKSKGMVNVGANRCRAQKCSRYPLFNFDVENKGIYCSEHKLEDMVDVVT